MTTALLLLRPKPVIISRCMLSVTSRKAMRKDVDDNSRGFREYELQRPDKRRRTFSKANMLFWMRKFERVPMNSNVELVYYFQPGLYFITSQFMLLPLISCSIYLSLMETTLPYWVRKIPSCHLKRSLFNQYFSPFLDYMGEHLLYNNLLADGATDENNACENVP